MSIYYYRVTYYSGGEYAVKKEAKGYTIARHEGEAEANVRRDYSGIIEIYVEERNCVEIT